MHAHQTPLLEQPTPRIINALHHLDPRLGVKTRRVESYWNVHCDLEWSWPAMSDLMLAQLDVFFVAHIVGWVVKAIVYPNIYVLLVRAACQQQTSLYPKLACRMRVH